LGPCLATPPLTVNVQDIREACATETTGINFLLLNEKMRNCKYQKKLRNCTIFSDHSGSGNTSTWDWERLMLVGCPKIIHAVQLSQITHPASTMYCKYQKNLKTAQNPAITVVPFFRVE